MLQRRFAWALKSSQSHADFRLDSSLFEHTELGCKLVHLKAADPNKAFAVMFRTTPANNSGVAHCLEHIALCGSSRFPVRDPFMKMLSRSLNSYMNAWTGSDFTMYPFATKNEKDFYNLLAVYLDASFFPLLTYPDFLQEAWRLEINKGKLEYKGVVFNEMKGKAADPNDVLMVNMMKEVLPGTCYEFNSGGDPRAIPQLKYEDLKLFHQQFYHPCNATFFMYGDMDIAKAMREVEEQALSRFSKIDLDTNVKIAKKRTDSGQIMLKVPPDPVPTDPASGRRRTCATKLRRTAIRRFY
jgi:presequence protease